MKIKKRTIKATEELIPEAAQLPVVEEVVVDECPECTEEACEEMCETTACGCCCYQEAIDNIMNAISSLGAFAKDDKLARESIANLSVVLFDLKG